MINVNFTPSDDLQTTIKKLQAFEKMLSGMLYIVDNNVVDLVTGSVKNVSPVLSIDSDNTSDENAVFSTSTITDNRLLKGDGGERNIQQTGITCTDANNLSGIGTISSGAITVTGASTIGDGGSTNYSQFEADGTLKFVGGATVWNDANVAGMTLTLPAASRPGEDNFEDNLGADTGIATLAFAVGEKASGAIELPHDYKEGTDLYFHIHWQGIAAPSDTDYVKWQCDYTLARTESAMATLDPVATVYVETAFDTRYKFMISTCTAITGTNYKIGDQFLFLLTRIAAAGDAYAGEALVATVGLHYECDTTGSRSILTK